MAGEIALPPDLVARGYRLVVRAPDRMYAVSDKWGCTFTCTTVGEVVKAARELIGFLDWMEANDRK